MNTSVKRARATELGKSVTRVAVLLNTERHRKGAIGYRKGSIRYRKGLY